MFALRAAPGIPQENTKTAGQKNIKNHPPRGFFDGWFVGLAHVRYEVKYDKPQQHHNGDTPREGINFHKKTSGFMPYLMNRRSPPPLLAADMTGKPEMPVCRVDDQCRGWGTPLHDLTHLI